MSTDMTLQIQSTGPEETSAIGERLGQKCAGGEFFVLSSDLGGGKTTFTKGLAKGLGSNAVVSSPTFTVSKVYECRDGLSLHHFDFYRLAESGMVGMELDEVKDDPKAVTVVEWGDIVKGILPEERITVQFGRDHSSEDTRILTITASPRFAHLIEGLA